MSEQHHPHLIDFNCYLITDRHATRGRPLVAAVEAAAHAGISAVQLREKDLNPRQLYALAEELRDVLKVTGTRLLINDRADIVAAAGLDGVHLTSNSITPCAARKCLPENSIIAVSTHSMAEARAAEFFGADFITFGPVFPTASKAAYGEPVGIDELANICATIKIPVFALGGVTPERVAICLQAGAHGVAAISSLLDVDDISGAVHSFTDKLP